MLHILIGEDDFSIHQALEEIRLSAGDPVALMPNTIVLEGAKVTPEQLRAACETVPFLADKRLVIVEGLFERFEVKGKGGKKKSAAQPDPAEACKPIAEAIKDLPPFTELVLLGGNIKSANALLLALSKAGKVKTYPPLKVPQIRQWVEKRVNAQSKSGITKGAMDLMVRLVGNDLWSMANEVDKLVLYVGERTIEEADVKEIVSNVRETKIYNMMDAIVDSQMTAAQTYLQQLYKQGMAPAQILYSLINHVSLIFQVKELKRKGNSLVGLQPMFRPTPPYVVQKAWEQADKYSLARIKDVYHKLLEADIAVKTGKYSNPDMVMDILIAEMGQRGAVSA